MPSTSSPVSNLSASDRPIGHYYVDQSGNSRYTLPIEVPNGTGNDNTPELSLDYQQGSSVGVLGIGWSINGLSSITLRPATASDPQTSHYMYDGKKLFQSSPPTESNPDSYYVTQIEEFRDIIFHGDDKGWTVIDDSGRRMEFGTTANSRLATKNDPAIVVEWRVKTNTDRWGNQMEYLYSSTPQIKSGAPTADSQNFSFLNEINYTSNVTAKLEANRRIEFYYLPRNQSDSLVSYSFGMQIILRHRLDAVGVYITTDQASLPGAFVREYSATMALSQLSGQTLVSSILEQDEQGNSLLPTKFSYTDIDPSASYLRQDTMETTLANSDSPQNSGLLPCAVAGNGLTDVVLVRYDQSTHDLSLLPYLAQVNGERFANPPAATVQWNVQTETKLASVPPKSDKNKPYDIIPTDLDGSGMTDLLVPFEQTQGDQKNLAFCVTQSNHKYFDPPQILSQNNQAWYADGQWLAIDADGTGRADIVGIHQDTNKTITFRSWLSRYGSSGGLAPVCISPTNDPWEGTLQWLAMDVSSNAAQDIVRVWSKADDMWATVYPASIDPGDPNKVIFKTGPQNKLFTQSGLNQGDYTALSLDVNHDDISDLAVCNATSSSAGGKVTLTLTTRVYLGNGLGSLVLVPGTDQPITINIAKSPSDKGIFEVADVDGDGIPSIIYRYPVDDRTWMAVILRGSTTATLKNPGVETKLVDCPSPGAQILFLSQLDLLGTGVAGWLAWGLAPSSNAIVSTSIYNDHERPFLLQETSDPAGLKTNVTYKTMADQSIYHHDSQLQFPRTSPFGRASLTLPMSSPTVSLFGSAQLIVASEAKSNDITISPIDYKSTQKRLYANAAVLLDGTGWIGFKNAFTVEVEQKCLMSVTYHQEPGLVGKIAAQETRAINNDIPADLWEALTNSTTYGRDDMHYLNPEIPATGNVPIRYAPLKDWENKTQYDSGSAARKFGVAYVYDKRANIILETPFSEDIKSGSRTTTLWKRYWYYQTPQTEHDHVYGLLQTTKASDRDGNVLQEEFQYGDMTLSQIRYGNSAPYDVQEAKDYVTEHGQYLSQIIETDPCGNVVSKTNSFTGLTKYLAYDDLTKSLVISSSFTIANENGNDQQIKHTKSYAWDVRFGRKIATMDENGVLEALLLLDSFGRDLVKGIPASIGTTGAHNLEMPVTMVADSELEKLLTAIPTVVEIENWRFGEDVAQFAATKTTTKSYSASVDDVAVEAEFLDCVGQVCMTQKSLNSQNSIWKANQYDAHGNRIAESLPITLPVIKGPNEVWINKDTLFQFMTQTFDVSDRPLLKHNPPGEDGGFRTDVQTNYTNGGGTIVTTTTQYDKDNNQSVLGQDTCVYELIGDQQRMTSVQKMGENQTRFKYNVLGNVLEIHDPSGRKVEQRKYDSSGRALILDNVYGNPLQNSQTPARENTYDLGGRLLTKTNAKGEKTYYYSDQIGRTQLITLDPKVDGRQIKWTYDNAPEAIGKPTSCTTTKDGKEQSKYVYTYDSRGDLSGVQTTLEGETTFTVSYGYDYHHRCVTKTLPDGSVVRTSQQGEVTKGVRMEQAPNTVPSPWAVEARYPIENFNAFLGCTNWTVTGDNPKFPAFTISASFNRYGMPTMTDMSTFGDYYVKDTYTWFGNSKVQTQSRQETQSGAPKLSWNKSYTYNNERLATSTGGSLPANASYIYNASGDLTNKAGLSLTYEPQLVTGIETDGSKTIISVSYDECGRMTKREYENKTVDFEYDGFDQVSKMTEYEGNNNPQVTLFVTNYEGRQIIKTHSNGTKILNVMHEYSVIVKSDPKKTTQIRRSLIGLDGRIAEVVTTATTGSPESKPTVSVYRSDHKGNVTHIFNKDGTNQLRISYDDFGLPAASQRLHADGLTPTYEGKRIELITKLLNFGARLYDPIIGRFSTPDTNWGTRDVTKPDFLNRYVFELNDPINHEDPSGHWSWSAILGVAIGAVLLVASVAVGAAPIVAALGGPIM